MPICLGITSGKGGTGKSTVAAGLAAAFSKKGRKKISNIFLYSIPRFNLYDIVKSRRMRI